MELTGNKVSIYPNIRDTTSLYTTTVGEALERIRTGKSAKKVIEIRQEPDKNRQNDLKEYLPCITFSGTFKTRVDVDLINHSGFICLDFDDVEIEDYVQKFKEWEYCFGVWVSPRGQGVKVLVKIANTKKHKEHFAALQKLFPNTDHKCINISRVCYESYDPNIYINTDSKVWVECIKFEVIEDRNVSVDTFEIYKKLIRWTETSTKTSKAFYEGNRNQFAYILSAAMCRHGVNQEDSKQLIVQDYSSNDFTAKEIEKTVWSAYKANKNNFGTVEFSNSNLRIKETKYEINPQILEEGFNPDGVVYGSSVYDKALDIYNNGYKSADSTFIPQLDNYWKFRRGELSLFSGIGNYGKTMMFNQLMVIRSLMAGDKWAVFSPEHTPVENFYFDFTEMLMGQPCNGGYAQKPPKEKFDEAYDFISKHFFYIYPDSISPTPEYIKTKFLELILKEKVTGCIIDPFNQLSNDYGKAAGRSDKYLETFLSDCLRFAQKNHVYFIIIAHPHKLQKANGGNYPCPDVFEIADGAMWNNKCDNILIYHRPFAQTEPTNPACEWHSKKIRFEKVLQVNKGSFEFTLNRLKRRFYFDGFSPLDGNRFEHTFVPPEQSVIDYDTKIRVGNPKAYITEPPF